jgi:hypothetical protein
MNNQKNWIKNKIRTGVVLLAAGIILSVAGILIGIQYAYLPYNFRIITGVGILLAGVGIGNLVRYGSALKDEQSARRLTIEEKDERLVQIRLRAGNKSFWVSTILVYIGLMWESFAANNSLPALSGDPLWYFLAACVLLPFGVYIASIVIDQQKS